MFAFTPPFWHPIYSYPSLPQISTPFLIAHTLQSLPPSLIPTHHLPTLLTSIHTIVSPLLLPSSPSSYPSWPDPTHNIHFENLYYHLSLLDMYLLGQWDTATPTSTLGADESVNNEVENAAENVQPTNSLPALAMESARSWLANVLVALGICAEILDGGTSLSSLQLVNSN
jgi:hypothetical protein